MHRFLKSSRAEHQQEVSSVSGEVILSPRGDATSICPITGQPSLAPISVTRLAIGAILRWTFPLRGALRAYPVPLLARGKCIRSEEHTSELQSHNELGCRLQRSKNNKTTRTHLDF